MTIPAGGAGPAGYSPVVASTGSTFDVATGSVAIDTTLKDFLANSAGDWSRIHYVDQIVILAVTIPAGSLKSAPEIGHTYRQIRTLNPRTILSDVTNRTQLALASVLGGKPKIELVSVDVDTVAARRGQLKIAVTYRNLLTNRIMPTARYSSSGGGSSGGIGGGSAFTSFDSRYDL
jgi:hypothetical protein